jgi:MFS-type transporter involved in bile tolerance (Atg22 family)
LIIPILALSQLAQAGFGAFVSSFMNNQLGARKPMVFLLRHFWTMIIFLVLALASKQFRMFTRRETPFIVLTGILGIFLKAQLTSK